MKILALVIDKTISNVDSPAFKRQEGYFLNDEVTLINLVRHVPKKVKRNNITVIGFNNILKPLIPVVFLYWILTEKFCGRKYDAVSSQDITATGFFGMLISELFDIPHLTQVHGDYTDNPLWIKQRKVVNRILNATSKIVLRRASGIRVVSIRIKDFLVSNNYAHESLIESIPIGSDLSIFGSVSRLTKKKEMIFIGRLIEEKGPLQFVDITSKVIKENPDWTIGIIGSGPLENEMRLKYEVLGTPVDKINFYGFLTPNEVAKKCAEATLYIHTAPWEGWGVCTIEAMATGCVVITNDTGCAGEAVINNKNGFIVETDTESYVEKINYCIQNPSVMEQISTQAATDANNWSLEVMTGKVQNHFIRFTSKDIFEKESLKYYLKTGIQLPKDSKTLLENQSYFEYVQPFSTEEIFPRIILEKGSLQVQDRNINYADISFSSEDNLLQVEILVSKDELYVKDYLQIDDRLIAAISGGFFFFVDEAKFAPEVKNYNLVISNNALLGLPISDRPILYTKNGKIDFAEVCAMGSLVINDKLYKWVGSKSMYAAPVNKTCDFYVYNSASCIINYKKHEGRSKRYLVEEKNFTPQNSSYIDYVIGYKDGSLQIIAINEGGGTNIFSGNFILQSRVRTKNLQIGNSIHNVNIDDIDITDMSEALTVGPNVFYYLNKKDHEITSDASLGNNEPFGDNYSARSIVYLDLSNKIHFRVFDEVPISEKFRGLTPQETADLMSEEKVKWAYHLDGGQSAKLAVRTKSGEIETFANKHYISTSKNDSTLSIWDPNGGRKTPSAIAIRKLYKNT